MLVEINKDIQQEKENIRKEQSVAVSKTAIEKADQDKLQPTPTPVSVQPPTQKQINAIITKLCANMGYDTGKYQMQWKDKEYVIPQNELQRVIQELEQDTSMDINMQGRLPADLLGTNSDGIGLFVYLLKLSKHAPENELERRNFFAGHFPITEQVKNTLDKGNRLLYIVDTTQEIGKQELHKNNDMITTAIWDTVFDGEYSQIRKAYDLAVKKVNAVKSKLPTVNKADQEAVNAYMKELGQALQEKQSLGKKLDFYKKAITGKHKENIADLCNQILSGVKQNIQIQIINKVAREFDSLQKKNKRLG